MEKLRIADNGNYLVTSDLAPFIWLADTAWTVPARLSWDDVQHYMKTRKEQGFTVLQMVVLDPEYNSDMKLLRQAGAEDILDMHEQAAENKEAGMLLVYFSADTEERIDLTGLLDGNVYGGWFNPSDGALDRIPNELPVSEGILSIANAAPDHLDRILILASDPDRIQVPSGDYGNCEENNELKKAFEW